jgi:hypothetical protein
MAHDGAAVRNVWTDRMTRHTLHVFRQGPFGGRAWSAQIRIMSPGAAARPAPGDIVVVFDPDQRGVCDLCGKYIRQALGTPVVPRPNWRQVFVGSSGALRAYAVRSG